MNPVAIADHGIIKLLEDERGRIESRYNLPTNSNIDPLYLFKPLDASSDLPNAQHKNKIIKIDKPKCLSDLADYTGYSTCTNAIIYLPKSVMDWHTNSNMVGNRCYITYSYGESVFRYQNQHGEIMDSHDIPNVWQIRRFCIPEDDLLWHTIASNGARITYGFSDGAFG